MEMCCINIAIYYETLAFAVFSLENNGIYVRRSRRLNRERKTSGKFSRFTRCLYYAIVGRCNRWPSPAREPVHLSTCSMCLLLLIKFTLLWSSLP